MKAQPSTQNPPKLSARLELDLLSGVCFNMFVGEKPNEII